MEGAPPALPARLTAGQQSVPVTLADRTVVWEQRTNLWSLFGLPDTADALRRFAAESG